MLLIVGWWLNEGALNRQKESIYLYHFALLLVLALALSRSDVNLAVAVAQREAATIPPHRRLATESCKRKGL